MNNFVAQIREACATIAENQKKIAEKGSGDNTVVKGLIDKTLNKIDIPNGVTSIGDYVFTYCDNLTSVIIPDSVTSIGSNAFSWCTNLPSMTIGDGVTSIASDAFQGCSGLLDIYVPWSEGEVANAPWGAVNATIWYDHIRPTEGLAYALTSDGLGYKCTGLGTATDTDIVIASSYNGLPVVEIADSAFHYKTSITSVNIPDTVTTIGARTFFNCYNLTDLKLPASITAIPEHMCHSCSKLTSIVIPESITTIGRYAFTDAGLISIDLPENLTTIEEYAFESTDLVSIAFPSKLTTIGNHAFLYCKSLESVMIPSSLINVGSSAFSECSNLVAVYIADIAAWCRIQFDWSTSNPLYYAKNLYLNGELITDLVIPDSITKLRSYTFSNCAHLRTVTIPSSVTSIIYPFNDCSNLDIYVPWSEGKIDRAPWGAINSNIWYDGKKSTESLTYRLSDDGTYYICTGIGAISTTDIVIGGKIEGLPVKEIEASAFENCNDITSVIVGYNVMTVGSSAFENCSNLATVDVYSTARTLGSNVFSNCTNLSTIKIHDNVTTIGESAFYNCLNITTLTLPESLTTISDCMFQSCTNLSIIVFGDNLKVIGANAFNNCNSLVSIGLTNSITTIANNAFSECFNLTDIYVLWAEGHIANTPWGATNATIHYMSHQPTIGINYALSDDGTYYICTGIGSAIDPDIVIATSIGGIPVQSIKKEAFRNNKTITSVLIPEGSMYIDNHAFTSCAALTTINVGDGNTLGSYVFSSCKALTKATIPSTLTEIPSGLFNDCQILSSVNLPDILVKVNVSAFNGCRKLIWQSLPTSLTEIGKNGFYYCQAFTQITLPDSLKQIGDYAFCMCNKVQTLTLGSSVESIGREAFEGLDVLRTLTIPAQVTNLGYLAFSYNDNLKTVYFEGTPTSVSPMLFYKCLALTDIYVPWKEGEVAKAPWGATNATIHYNSEV